MSWEQHLQEYTEFLKHKYRLSDEQIRAALFSENIPVEAFAADLTPLQAAAHHLQQRGKQTTDIARLLGRSIPEVEKFLSVQAPQLPAHGTLSIPADLFADRSRSASEHLVFYLESQGKSVADIARVLNKAEPTIWTLHYRNARGGRQ